MGQRTERKHRRVRARSMVAHLTAGETQIVGEVENISPTGFFVRTEEVLFLGAKVQVDLVRSGGKSILSLPGLVADMLEADRAASLGRKTGMGISFDPIGDPALKERLERLLREMTGAAPPPPAPGGADSELARLQAQVRGLLIDISDLKRSVAERDAVIAQLQGELAQLKR
jgi:hypothetical protein